jgi:hypothetical protein
MVWYSVTFFTICHEHAYCERFNCALLHLSSSCSAFWLSWGHCYLVEEAYCCSSAAKLSVSPERGHWGVLLQRSWRTAVGELKVGLTKLWVLIFRLLWYGCEQTCGQNGNVCGVWEGEAEGRDRLECLRIGGSVLLKLMLEKQDKQVWNGSVCLSTGNSGGLLEHGTEPSLSIKYKVLKVKFTPYIMRWRYRGEYSYSSTFYLTSALDRGGLSTPRPGRFTPGDDPIPFVYEAGWAPEPIWTGAENSPLPGFNPRSVQPVASRYTDDVITAYKL